MSNYLDSSLFEVTINFYNQKSGSPHIYRIKTGVKDNSHAFPALYNDRKVNLRRLIQNTITKIGVKKLGIEDAQWEFLGKVDMFYQRFYARQGTGYFINCQWTVENGLDICEVIPDPDYVQQQAVYTSFDHVNGFMGTICNVMRQENLSSYENEYGKGRRFVMQAEDYPHEETQARYDAYWRDARQSWMKEYTPYFTRYNGENMKKKTVVVATKHSRYGVAACAIIKQLREQGAVVKDQIGKAAHYLLVDMEAIEKLDCYAERRWRMEKGENEIASKIPNQAIARAVAFNEAGSSIQIISLQEFLEAHNLSYDELTHG